MKCFFHFWSLILILLLPFGSVGQGCTAEASWTLSPPPSSNNTYDAGTTVQICVDVLNVSFYSFNQLQGMVIQLPDAWDPATINVISAPGDSTTEGNWVFLDSVSCNFESFGSGFYYDFDTGDGLDGNPCNNLGEAESSIGNDWQFCIEVTLVSDCGGPDDPLHEADIMPGLKLVSDAALGNGTILLNCPPVVVYPDIPELTLNCCDANSGVSPGTLISCGDQIISLYNELLQPKDPGGSWVGPDTIWTDQSGTGAGIFDPSTDPLGEYTYTVTGADGCVNSTTINVSFDSMGLVQSVDYCAYDPVALSDLLTDFNLPESAVWYYPGYPEIADSVPNGIINPTTDPPGVYTASFYSDDSCITTLDLSLVLGVNPIISTEVTVTQCGFGDSFCPFEVLQNQFSDSSLFIGGNWIVWDNSSFLLLDYFPDYDVCVPVETLAGYGANSILFQYLTNNPPCGTDLAVEVTLSYDNSEFYSSAFVCPDEAPYYLPGYLPEEAPPFGVWLDENGSTITQYSNLNPDSSQSVYTFHYILSNGDCQVIYNLDLEFGNDAGEDLDLYYCAADTSISLYSELPENTSMNGFFSPTSLVDIGSPGSDEYLYILPGDSSCAADTAVYTVTVSDDLEVSAVLAECTEDPSLFTVSFEIENGLPPYAVNGQTLSGSSFLSEAIPVSTADAQFVVDDNGACPQVIITAGVSDTDGDGICDEGEIVGCQDSTAANYNPEATDPGLCMYELIAEDEPDVLSLPDTGSEGGGFGVGGNGFNQGEPTLEVFPNPSEGDVVTVIVHGVAGPFGQAKIEIRDVLGNIQIAQTVESGKLKIPIHNLAAGLYLLQFRAGNTILTKRLIVNR